MNVCVLGGLVTELPFADGTLNSVISGRVAGDDSGTEITEIICVCKPGGWLLDCPGDSERDMSPSKELTSRGHSQSTI